MVRQRMFIILLLLGNFHLTIRLIQLLIIDIAPTMDANFVAELGEDFGGIALGSLIFFDFLRFQTPLLFVVMIYAGSGLICNDFRNNLIEIYFSKPINWRDYLAGKVATLMLIGLSLSALPAYLLVLVHVLFSPSQDTLREAAGMLWPITAFSVILVLSCALSILAISALVNSARFAAITVYMIVFLNSTLGLVMALITAEPRYSVIAFPVSLHHLGEILFDQFIILEMPWQWPIFYVLLVCGGSLAVLCVKIRNAEMGK